MILFVYNDDDRERCRFVLRDENEAGNTRVTVNL